MDLALTIGVCVCLQIPDVSVKVVPTKAAHFFFTSEQVNAEICTDEQEWAVS